MALADYKPVRSTIEYGNKPLVQVRGLSVSDVSILVRAHLEDFERAWAVLSDMQSSTQDILHQLNVEGLILRGLTEFPMFCANIIAIASDEPDNADDALHLPAPLQIEIMYEIVRLTFEDVGGPKAFVALVHQMLTWKSLPAGTTTTR